MQILKSIILGIIQGITEWLPISSTAHMLLFDEFFKLNTEHEFFEMYLVVIQLFSVMAVPCLYWKKLFPFGEMKNRESRKRVFLLWQKIFVACLPLAFFGIFIDKAIENLLYKEGGELSLWGLMTMSLTLIGYGIIFILIEKKDKGKKPLLKRKISFFDSFTIGCVQCLAALPGTSRSGATIMGARLLHIDRSTSAEFSFLLALPVMFSAGIMKIGKFALNPEIVMTKELYIIMLSGGICSFAVSLMVIKGLLRFVKNHTFSSFGVYRIALGIAIALYAYMKG